MIRLSAKLMEEKLKRGWTTQQFIEYLGVDSDKHLRESLKRVFSSRYYESLVNRIERNDKKYKKIGNSSKEKEALDTAVKEDISGELTDSKSKNSEICDKNDTMEVLQNQLDVIVKKIDEKKDEYLRFFDNRKRIKQSLIENQKELSILKKKISKIAKMSEQKIKELNDESKKMAIAHTEIESLKNDLANTEKKIKDLECVSIFVYSDGRIEMENYKFNNIPESWSKKFFNFANSDVADNLTVGETKQLSKVCALTEMFKDEEKNYEVIFDNKKMEAIYLSETCK